MDAIKIFAKHEEEQETLIQTIRINSQDRKMEFGMEKCAMLIMKSRKREKKTRKEWNYQSGNHQNAFRRGKLQIIGCIGSEQHYKNRDEIKKKKEEKSISEERENFSKPGFAAEISSKE